MDADVNIKVTRRTHDEVSNWITVELEKDKFQPIINILQTLEEGITNQSVLLIISLLKSQLSRLPEIEETRIPIPLTNIILDFKILEEVQHGRRKQNK